MYLNDHIQGYLKALEKVTPLSSVLSARWILQWGAPSIRLSLLGMKGLTEK